MRIVLKAMERLGIKLDTTISLVCYYSAKIRTSFLTLAENYDKEIKAIMSQDIQVLFQEQKKELDLQLQKQVEHVRFSYEML